jgi:hypothetical protein
MRAGRGAGDQDAMRDWFEPCERDLPDDHHRRGRRQCGWHRGHAANAAVHTDFAIALVGGRRRPLGGASVADKGIGLRGGFGCRLGSTGTRDQARERNRISGGERNNALLQRSLGECFGHRGLAHRRHTHGQVSEDRLPDDKQPSGKEIPTPAESPPDNPRAVFGDARLPEKCLTYNVALLVALPSPARQRGSGKAIGRQPALSSRIS